MKNIVLLVMSMLVGMSLEAMSADSENIGRLFRRIMLEGKGNRYNNPRELLDTKVTKCVLADLAEPFEVCCRGCPGGIDWLRKKKLFPKADTRVSLGKRGCEGKVEVIRNESLLELAERLKAKKILAFLNR